MKLDRISLSAMALAMPDIADHPNRAPFSGVLTRVGVPSDAPPGGSGGKRILLTADAVEKAIPSLLGMGINVSADLDAHAPQAKVGVITSAHVSGDEVMIAGHLYEADFPDIVARVRAEKDALGFSFEAQDALVTDPRADPAEVTQLVFTGAAILFKDKAAYTSTSLTAAAELELHMKPEELEALLNKSMASALAPITARLDKIESAGAAKLDAASAVMERVEPHAAALEKVAGDMEADGVGADPQNGHAVVLRKMAGKMRSDAALGKVPSASYSYDYYAAATPKEEIDAAVAAATGELRTKLEAAESKLADKEGTAFHAARAPERKTLSPAITALLARAGVTPGDDEPMPVGQLDDALTKAGIDPSKRIEIKAAMRQSGAVK